ncbi:MAG TPA: hypothetical protein VMU34_20850 [Mycobacterium sp.]|nr:hypothetical protein [Mycobacterium sp.]
MNRSRLAALSAGAMFLVASVLVPATAMAAGSATIKVVNHADNSSTITYAPPATGQTLTVDVVANATTVFSGAGAALTFDNTKLHLNSVVFGPDVTAKNSCLCGSFGGYPVTISDANTGGANPGLIPVVGFSFGNNTAPNTFPANTDVIIFTAQFTVTAQGNSSLVPSVGTTGGVLDGTTGSYGASLPVTLSNATIQNSNTPSWSLSAPATAMVLTGGTSANYAVSTTVAQADAGTITFSATNLPANVSASFTPPTVGGDANHSTQLQFTALGNATPGTYSVTVTGTDSQTPPVAHSKTVSLTVAGNDDFGIAAAPASVSVNDGGAAANATVTITTLNGNPGSVALSATGLPSGVTAVFTPTSVTPGTTSATSTVAFTASGATGGLATVTIAGDSNTANGTYHHTTSVTLNVIVTPAGGQNVTVTGTLDQGFLGLTCPTSLSIPLLRGNTNQLNVPCQVYTNTVWNLNVSDPKATNKGHMTSTDTPPYVMPDSMHVLANQFVFGGSAFYASDVDLANGNGTQCTASPLVAPCPPASVSPITGGTILSGTNSAAAPLVVSQFVAPNTHPGTYGIQVLFSAMSVF